MFAVLLLTMTAAAQGELVQLNPLKDNTLYQRSEALSNGAGIGIFAGRTGDGSVVRGVMAFDLSGIPPGSTITSVTLTLGQTNTNDNTPQPQVISIHRLTNDWGEGTSVANLGGGGGGAGGPATAGDATWLHTFFDTALWESPGGDFVVEASASTEVAGNGDYIWQSEGMVADVQAWIDNPQSNFGWLLRGNENVTSSAKRFGSRESDSPPVLQVEYTTVDGSRPPLTHTIHFPQFANGQDFFSRLALLNPSQSAVFAEVALRTDGGEPLPLTLNGTSVPENGLIDLEIPPGGLRVFQTNATGALQTGPVTVRSSAPLTGVIVFGGALGSAAIVAVEEISDGFAAPVESRGNEVRTGLAVQNVGQSPATVTLELLDADGLVLATTELEIPPLGKIARFIDELQWDNAIDFTDFNGSVRALSMTPLAAALVQNRVTNGIVYLATIPLATLQ